MKIARKRVRVPTWGELYTEGKNASFRDQMLQYSVTRVTFNDLLGIATVEIKGGAKMRVPAGAFIIMDKRGYPIKVLTEDEFMKDYFIRDGDHTAEFLDMKKARG